MKPLRQLFLLSGVFLSLATSSLWALPVMFTLDSTQSVIRASGNAAGFPLTEQGPGSLTFRFAGSLFADLTSTHIEFNGDSVLDAITNGSWQPLPGGADGSAPADFAGQVSVPFFGTGRAAFRSVVLGLSSPAILVNNGSFDPAPLRFFLPTNSSSQIDYNAGGRSGSATFSGVGTNGPATNGTLVTIGDVQTINIQVDAQFSFRVLSANDSRARLSGQLIASRVVQPVVDSIEVSGQNITFQITAPTGQNYILESSTDLHGWNPRTATVTPTPTGYIYSATLSGTLEFFRLHKQGT
jgi:hypothetical protein